MGNGPYRFFVTDTDCLYAAVGNALARHDPSSARLIATEGPLLQAVSAKVFKEVYQKLLHGRWKVSRLQIDNAHKFVVALFLDLNVQETVAAMGCHDGGRPRDPLLRSGAARQAFGRLDSVDNLFVGNDFLPLGTIPPIGD